MTKNLSRRDAIKLLGAATGVALLANLPSKWSKPSLMSGVLPAHAQTSIFFTITNGGFTALVQNSPDESGEIQEVSAARSPLSGSPGFAGSHFIVISPVMENIPLVLVTSSAGPVNWNVPNPAPDGTYLTDTNGKVMISINVGFTSALNFSWTFQSPYTGTGVTFTIPSPII